ncbi:MAG: hypothetical protein WDO73_23630 [Ignavibacteriota bacterium]
MCGTEGFYDYRGGRYVWVPGRWMRPPRAHAVWVPGGVGAGASRIRIPSRLLAVAPMGARSSRRAPRNHP